MRQRTSPPALSNPSESIRCTTQPSCLHYSSNDDDGDGHDDDNDDDVNDDDDGQESWL